MTDAEEAEVLAMLDSVGEPGGLTLMKAEPWGYAGMELFELSNGATVEVFNDCDCWDYIDNIVMPDGRRWEYPHKTTTPMTDAVADWCPPKKHADTWQVPVETCQEKR